ncbi:PREDICTED: 28S ribosomal protein S7, mitochondrial [Polistes dominula]|uniref:28S ribosomal protein S7, mitochondrial n=1 Tax=Polistes dominula TaxID=743375 RepID=A0ABM1ICJ7_POLDO|nr:PREDICTED: 28S ribosomal protein S7, mitochondrial [Polistes dominula]
MSNLRIVVKKSINILNFCGNQRCYSLFPTHYIKPIYNKEEQQNLYASKEIKEIIHKSFRPAVTTDSSSEFYDNTVNRFINYIMRKGKKELARKLLQNTFETIKVMQIKDYHRTKSDDEKEAIELDPKVIFITAIENVTPILELKRHRRGGINYKIPVAISPHRAKFLAMNWLIQAAKTKEKEVHFPEQLARELIDAFNKRGRVIMKKHDLHKECDANRAYAHFRWMKK